MVFTLSGFEVFENFKVCLPLFLLLHSQFTYSQPGIILGTECGHILLWNLTTQLVTQTISYSDDGSSLLSVHALAADHVVGILTYSRNLSIRYHAWNPGAELKISDVLCGELG